MPSRTVPTSSVLDSLVTSIPKAFEQAQISSANHQKNFVALHKLHADAAKHTESVNNGNSIKLTGERAFEDVFIDMVSRVLSVKKGASQADRIVRFVGGYTKFINGKGEHYFCNLVAVWGLCPFFLVKTMQDDAVLRHTLLERLY
jgi:condensin complex subunit 3